MKRNLVGIGTGLTVAALAASGCLAEYGGTEVEVEERSSAINLGKLETGYPAVGKLDFTIPEGGRSCTGTLIAPSWVLTAAHCLGTSMTFKTGTDASNFVSHTIDYKTLHPTLHLALVHLVAPIDDIPVMRVNAGGSFPAPGTICTAVGFGEHQEPDGTFSAGVKRSATERITTAPNNPNNSTIQVEIVSGLVDNGDSGGPLICNNLIEGVAWYGDPNDDWPNYSKAVYATEEAAWIERTIAPTYFDVTLRNGWVASGMRTPGAALVGDVVHLKGTITNGTASEVFELPALMAPSERVYVPVDLCAGKKGRLIVETTGIASVSPLEDAQCFASLDGVKFARNSRGYAPLTLAAGWSAYGIGTAVPAVSKVDGIVRFRGALKTTQPETSPFILPVGLRPAKVVYMAADLCGGTNGHVVVTPAGAVGVLPANGDWSAVTCFTSLEGLEFAADPFGFQILGLQNGWTIKPSAEEPGAQVISGVVHLKGAIKTTGTNANPFTLSTALRPSRTVSLDVVLCNGAKGRLLITSSGVATVSVPSTGVFSDAQCMTSLDGVTFPQSDFTPLIPENGWRPYSTATARPAVSVAGGIVRLKGAMSSTTSTVLAFRLPRSTNPTGTVYLPIDVFAAAKGRLRFATDGSGTVSDQAVNLADAKRFTSLDGVGFPVAPVAFSLSNGWTSYSTSTRPPSAVRIDDIVYLAGAIKTSGTNMNPINFASGWRPEANVYVSVDINGGKKGYLKIQPDGVVTVGTNGGSTSDLQSFVSLEGVSFATSTSTFNSMALANSWIDGNLNTRHAKARNVNGIVQLAGAATSGTNSSMFTLPSTMRPLSTTYVNVDLCAGIKGRLIISPSGNVAVQSSTGGLAMPQCLTSLEGAWFAIQ